jgi:hypothetical protein
MRNTARLIVAMLVLTAAAEVCGTDWILAPSTYTHDPQTGERISQFAPIPPVYLRQGRPDFVQSGYRHRQSVIRDPRGSADRLHVTEEWGRPVRPYGEWRFPYRPYSVPYPLWGPPNANWHWWQSYDDDHRRAGGGHPGGRPEMPPGGAPGPT